MYWQKLPRSLQYPKTVILHRYDTVQYSTAALQKTRDPGIRDPSSIDISRKIFEISRKIFEIWQYNITNKKTAYYFFEPLVQPFEHFKHCNTDIITLYTHAY